MTVMRYKNKHACNMKELVIPHEVFLISLGCYAVPI